MQQTYRTAQWVPFPVDRVFAFFADPENLPRLMPHWQQVRLEKSNSIHSIHPPEDHRPIRSSTFPQYGQDTYPTCVAGAGSTMVVTFRPIPFLPLRLSWEVRIAEFVLNEFFCDQQERGPFKFWRHCHRTCEEVRGGVTGTLVADEVEYELPFHAIGAIVNVLIVRKQIESLFEYRQRKLQVLLRESD